MTGAIIFGSIGTIVEASETQREAFNRAFQEAGLDWHWDKDDYKERLKTSGGKARIEAYADERGQQVDASALHQRKTELFDEAMVSGQLQPRPGVADVIREAKQCGIKLGFATTTSQGNIDAMFDALKGQIDRSDFDFSGDASMVEDSKPAPDIYRIAVEQLQVDAEDCVAIDDTAVSMRSGRAAGINCIAFPGAYADRSEFQGGTTLLDELSVENLTDAH